MQVLSRLNIDQVEFDCKCDNFCIFNLVWQKIIIKFALSIGKYWRFIRGDEASCKKNSRDHLFFYRMAVIYLLMGKQKKYKKATDKCEKLALESGFYKSTSLKLLFKDKLNNLSKLLVECGFNT